MKTLEDIKKHLSKYDKNQVINVLCENSMLYLLGREMRLDESCYINKEYYFLKMLFYCFKKELSLICKTFEDNTIQYIAFKGIVLSNCLYRNVEDRFASDIDVYVCENDYDRAFRMLQNIGFEIVDSDVLNNKHHLAMKKGLVLLELHKNILNPLLNIDETYLRMNTIDQIVFDRTITTFNETATLLHMLYHLYMDMIIGPQFVKAVYAKNLLLSKKFLFRAYEIALYIEKYFDKINWQDIINDILKQNLKSYFKSMIHGILNIFPQVFPEFFVKAIYEKDYEMILDDVDQMFCEYLVTHNDYECAELVEKFINEKWNGREVLNLTEKTEKTFLIPYHHWKVEEEFENDADFKCTCTVINRSNKIEVFFEVLQEDICFSEENQLDDSETDGIHLFLCSTHKFLYRSIFLFPKIICGETKVIAIDAVTNEGVEDLICNLEITSNGYHLGIFLNAPFIKKNLLESNFYLGAIAAKCCPNTGKRIRELTMSPRVEYWYSPTWFAKVEW